MRSSRSFVRVVLMVAVVVGIALPLAAVALADEKHYEKIKNDHDPVVAVSPYASCSDDSGSFQAIHKGRKVVVTFQLEEERGKKSKHEKHGKHSKDSSEVVEVYDEGKEVAHPREYLCPRKGESANKIAGELVKVEGEWKDDKTVEAKEIYIRN